MIFRKELMNKLILNILRFDKFYITLNFQRICTILIVRVKNEADGLGLTRTHNLFVRWAWISYIGLFSAQRLLSQLPLLLSGLLKSLYSLFLFQPSNPHSSFSFSYLQPSVSGGIYDCLQSQCNRRSNIINRKWVFRWEWLWNQFPLQQICLAAIFPKALPGK